MTRVALAKIPALTFYQDSITLSRRSNPIPQLTCIGKACDLYMPEVVRCENIGGQGREVDWKVKRVFVFVFRFLLSSSLSVKLTFRGLYALEGSRCPVKAGQVQEIRMC
jgi:hypothetical protein